MPRLYRFPDNTPTNRAYCYANYGNFCIDRNYRIYYNLVVTALSRVLVSRSDGVYLSHVGLKSQFG
jgi:hypothetical protein